VYELGVARWPACVVVIALTVLALGVPLANLIYKAGLIVVVDEATGEATQGWSAERFAASTLPASPNPLHWKNREEYYHSLAVGGWVVIGSVALATLLAWAARGRGPGAIPAYLSSALGFALPGPLVALGVIWLLNRPSPAFLPWLYDETVLAPALAIGVRTLPIATWILWGAFRSIDNDQLDAARADGASNLSLLSDVVLPQRWRALSIAALAAFAIAAGDLASSLLVIPPGRPTIANHIFLLIHAGVHNAEAGLCLGQAAVFSVLAIGVLALSARGQD
jgi:iron(III) transport system permease protein